jgi:hypothetical protein
LKEWSTVALQENAPAQNSKKGADNPLFEHELDKNLFDSLQHKRSEKEETDRTSFASMKFGIILAFSTEKPFKKA